MLSRKWKVELTLDELIAIERALSRVTAAGAFQHEDVRVWESLRKIALALAPLRGAAAESTDTLSTSPSRHNDPRRPAILLDEASLTVSLWGRRFPCKPTSFRLLAHLIHNQGRWIRSEALKHEVLQVSVQPGASNVRWHVLQARRALHTADRFLHSDCRLGYMFTLDRCDRRHCALPSGHATHLPADPAPALRRWGVEPIR